MENDGFTHIAHQRRRRFLATTVMWQIPQPRFTQSFSSYYFKCNGYGHRISECKYNVGPRNFSSRNMLAPLMDYAVECYNYHKYGHIVRNCTNTFFSNQFQQKSFQSRGMRYNRKIPKRQQTKQEEIMHESKIGVKKIWKEKKQPKYEKESLIVQIALKAENKPAPWILDSGCSSHMIRDKRRFE